MSKGRDVRGLATLEPATVGKTFAAWRQKAARNLLLASAIMYLPAIILLLTGLTPPLTVTVKVTAVVAYLVTGWAAWRSRTDYRLVWATVISGYIFATLGSIPIPHPLPRMILIALPIIAMVLFGTRTGRWATGISIAILLLNPAVVQWVPNLSAWMTPENAVVPPPRALWVQAISLSGMLLVTVTLVDGFQRLLMKSLGELEQEAAERLAGYQNLQREMEQRQRLEQELARVSDEERRRLGHDLHDGVCQQLTGARLRCEVIRRRLGRGESLEEAELAALSDLLEHTVDEAYAVARGLSPLQPEPDALANALQTLSSRTQQSSGLQCSFSSVGDVGIPDHTAAQHLYRIAQEALSNATRHAHARKLKLELHGSQKHLTLLIEDDGDGLPSKSCGNGLGLRTMASRAASIGGELIVGPAPDRGTRVTCRIPRDNPNSQDRQNPDMLDAHHES